MTPLLGYWHWDGETTLLRTPDGATVTYLGPDEDRPRTATTRWLRFKASAAQGTFILSVEQRLRGRDVNFRALWYRFDLAGLAHDPALADATMRLFVDALSCWPASLFATRYPTGIGVVGGHADGHFIPELHRLYLHHYAKKTFDGGELPPLPPPGSWEYYPLDESRPAPDLDRAAAGDLATQRAFIADAAMRGPTLVSGDRMVIIRTEARPAQIIYADSEIFSDGFRCFKDQHGNWHVAAGDKFLGTRLLATGMLPKPPKGSGPANIIDQALMRFADRHDRLRRRPGKPVHQLGDVPTSYIERFHVALEEAMLHLLTLPKNGDDLPRRVEQGSSILRAGRSFTTLITSLGLPAERIDHRDDQMWAAFSDDPAHDRPLAPSPGAKFDGSSATLTAPDGSSLAFEWRDSDRLTPLHLRFRCRSAGLDWPVLVTRRDQRPEHNWSAEPQLLNRWQVDHGQCLLAWQAEGHRGLPDPVQWDRLRMFIEDAFLSWGDSPAAGPAPQSLETFGGYYDGEWRDRQFRRLLGRPDVLPSDPIRQQPWTPYEPAAHWRASQSGDPSEPPETSLPFEKRRTDSARLFASGHSTRTDSQGCTYRTDYVDYLDASVRIRMVGKASALHSGSVWTIPLDALPVDPGVRSTIPDSKERQPPALSLWRHLRDAAESGLALGEMSDLAGGWIFDSFHPRVRRITALGNDYDFDYRMTS